MFFSTLQRLLPSQGSSKMTKDLLAAFKVLGLQYPFSAPKDGTSSSIPPLAVVRQHYRELARLHHPDLSSGDDQRMKVINTAYELIQSSDLYTAASSEAAAGGGRGSAPTGPTEASESAGNRFKRKAGSRRRRVPDDFANGDDTQSWAMKSTLDWDQFVGPRSGITEQELKNPVNHPFSHSKFFSFQDDATIYHMLRGGATVEQTSRTLGKPSTFVERRLHNAQFKLRVRYILRQEKQQQQKEHKKDQQRASKTTASGSPSRSSALYRAYDDGLYHSSFHVATTPPRKREWEPTFPSYSGPRFEVDMSLEELGEKEGVLRGLQDEEETGGSYQRHAAPMSRSYDNYKRLRPKKIRHCEQVTWDSPHHT